MKMKCIIIIQGFCSRLIYWKIWKNHTKACQKLHVSYTKSSLKYAFSVATNLQSKLFSRISPKTKKSNLDVCTCTGASSPDRVQTVPWLSRCRALWVWSALSAAHHSCRFARTCTKVWCSFGSKQVDARAGRRRRERRVQTASALPVLKLATCSACPRTAASTGLNRTFRCWIEGPGCQVGHRSPLPVAQNSQVEFGPVWRNGWTEIEW